LAGPAVQLLQRQKTTKKGGWRRKRGRKKDFPKERRKKNVVNGEKNQETEEVDSDTRRPTEFNVGRRTNLDKKSQGGRGCLFAPAPDETKGSA